MINYLASRYELIGGAEFDSQLYAKNGANTETIFNTLLYPIELKWTYPPMGLEPITYGLQGIEVLL